MKLKNYILNTWIEGEGIEKELYSSIDNKKIAQISAKGLKLEEVYDYARKTGTNNLSKMTFHQRGVMLKELAIYLQSKRDKFYEISYQTGATKLDSWIDIDGGIGNLFANASLRRQFPDLPYCTDGEMIDLSKGGNFVAQHLLIPKKGVAVHINAFNFPVWGMLEKIAVNFMAGMSAIVKPASISAYLNYAVVEEIDKSGILPKGALQVLYGNCRDLINYVDCEDVVSFTGSAETGKMLKKHKNIIENSVPFNLEADSLNCIVLGNDISKDDEEYNIFLKEVIKEMTIKAGQKCTAIRRIFVHKDIIKLVKTDLLELLKNVKIGSPIDKETRMGSISSIDQVKELYTKINLLKSQSEILTDEKEFDLEMIDNTFVKPVLLENKNPLVNNFTHDIEAFGPVSTIMAYNDIEEATVLANLGKGSLVTTIVTKNDEIALEYILKSGSLHGRILVLNRDSAQQSTGHGSPMPLLVHGGPGRAGGGEEMGGIRGIKHYMQRTAIQGSPTSLTNITKKYFIGTKLNETHLHPFRKHFEDLEVGETWITHKHTVTESDIVNFANISGDNFYAHMDETSLEGTIFERRVAHGYFILSKAAGLFVEPKKGPVLLNYGIEDARFTKPVYVGTTIGVKFTVKEKVNQDKKSDDDIEKGIVKFLVEVLDQENELVAIATILTMVKKK